MATHYYIKFMPANQADYAKLKVDTNLICYPFPLDAAISQYSGSYRDPTVPAGVPTYQYASVPVNYVLPKVPYVKLADLFLPDESSTAKPITLIGADNSFYSVSGRVLANESICPEVEDEGGGPQPYELEPAESCDNEYGGGGPSTGTDAPPGEWRPSGRITMNDDSLGLIGVEGIKVRARRWFTTYTGITDANGYYHVDGTYSRPANYWFNFERYDFSVNDHRGGPQEIGEYKLEGPWNFELENYDKFCGTIFRAAFHYYHKDIQGLRRPPQNSFWATQVKLAAFDWQETSDNGSMWAGRNTLLGSLIHIYKPQRGSMETYATTIHELAHAVHWDMYPHVTIGTYAATSNKVIESWAAGVQWVLTRMVYPGYVGRYCDHGETYTNVVMDMIDPYNASYTDPYDQHYGFAQSKDLVDGYSIVQIQDAMHGETSWEGWKNNIKNSYNNGTEQHLDALFNNWWNW